MNIPANLIADWRRRRQCGGATDETRMKHGGRCDVSIKTSTGLATLASFGDLSIPDNPTLGYRADFR